MTAPPPEAHQLPPEASLIRLARMARGMSPESAADLTPIRLGGSRWREIEKGYKGKSVRQVVRARALTLAHMAHVVGVSPERLVEAGRGDAAEILREIQRQEAEEEGVGYPDRTDYKECLIWDMPNVSEADRRLIIDLLRIGKAQQRKSG